MRWRKRWLWRTWQQKESRTVKNGAKSTKRGLRGWVISLSRRDLYSVPCRVQIISVDSKFGILWTYLASAPMTSQKARNPINKYSQARCNNSASSQQRFPCSRLKIAHYEAYRPCVISLNSNTPVERTDYLRLCPSDVGRADRMRKPAAYRWIQFGITFVQGFIMVPCRADYRSSASSFGRFMQIRTAWVEA
jgi:hypothetical protein